MLGTAGKIRMTLCDVLLWTPTYGLVRVGQPASTYMHQLCVDTGYNLEDLPGVMDNRRGWQVRVKELLSA